MNITLTDYQTQYNDITDTSLFSRLLEQAESLLASYTVRRADEVTSATDYRYVPVQNCLIAIIHFLNTADPIGSAGIKSASNDGYSESYSTTTESNTELKELIYDKLSGTGLTGCW